MKILNLYAGIGGNRKLWGDEHEVTAVEYEPYIAEAYKKMYPNDTVIIADAHEYLLQHGNEFDFIWSSPPCPTHSRANNFLHAQGIVRYPDMSLYQEILWLTHRFKGKWLVENVIPYYKPLIEPSTTIDRHNYWSNFTINDMDFKRTERFNVINSRASTRKEGGVYQQTLETHLGIVLPEGTKNQRKLLRNAVHPEMGLHILKSCINDTSRS